MGIWSDMKVKSKLLVMICGFSLALTIVGVTGLVNMHRMSVGLGELNIGMKHVESFLKMKNDFLQMRLNLLYVVAVDDAGQIIEKSEDFEKKAKAIKETMADLKAYKLADTERESIELFSKGFEDYWAQGSKVMKASIEAMERGDIEGRQHALDTAVTKVAPLYNKPAEAIAAMVEKNIKESDQIYRHDVAEYRSLRWIMVIVIAMTILVALIAGIAVGRSIANPLGKVLNSLSAVAAGDLTARVAVTSRDEMGLLAAEVNTMAEKLSGIMTKVAVNTSHVASAATQLYSTSEQMATGAEEVAAQAGTVATASEEMAATSTEIAANCTQAFQSSEQAGKAAKSGADTVHGSLAVMGRIADQVNQSAKTIESLGARSEQIGEIVAVIEDIADQTNLLALNAAIEAARAGEQGRGFAVVADEVRALAERTAKATKEISAMIKTIQQETRQAVTAMHGGVREVEVGTAEAARSGEALGAILDQISSVSQQVSQIATAAEEQTATTTEISNNIQQITEVIQETAKGAQESAMAANQLAKLAEELQKLVNQFRVAS